LDESSNIHQTTEIEDLRKVLRFHEYRYYVMDDPLLADLNDQCIALEKMKKNNPALITSNFSYATCAKGLTKIFHGAAFVGMLRWNSYNAEDLLDWDRKFAKPPAWKPLNIVQSQSLTAPASADL